MTYAQRVKIKLNRLRKTGAIISALFFTLPKSEILVNNAAYV
ncbi:hypothetical protein QE390_005174 [Siphonobacter sp. SORGH_AS 1065]|nr:hypothetical protein [Siphonobacter sp. SORGH_AS_1065]